MCPKGMFNSKHRDYTYGLEFRGRRLCLPPQSPTAHRLNQPRNASKMGHLKMWHTTMATEVMEYETMEFKVMRYIKTESASARDSCLLQL